MAKSKQDEIWKVLASTRSFSVQYNARVRYSKHVQSLKYVIIIMNITIITVSIQLIVV